MSDIYSASDIIGQTLYAKVNVPIYAGADDTAIKIGEVKAGNPIGVVYTYLNVNPAMHRSDVWWAFISGDGMWYYTPHVAGRFDLSAVKANGILSIDEKAKAAAEAEKLANMPWYERLITKSIAPIVIGAALIFVAPKVIEAVKKK